MSFNRHSVYTAKLLTGVPVYVLKQSLNYIYQQDLCLEGEGTGVFLVSDRSACRETPVLLA